MQFELVNKEDIPKGRTRTGGRSQGLVDAFLSAITDDGAIAKVSRDDIAATGKKMESVRSTVSNYVKRHELPVRVFTAQGDLYLERSDEAAAKYAKENANASAPPETVQVTEDA